MKGKILVVEDDPSILRGLQLNLGMEGYTVRSAMDGEAGLALARSERPDLLLVDVMLPKLDGLAIIRSLRATDPDLPILILSAKGHRVNTHRETEKNQATTQVEIVLATVESRRLILRPSPRDLFAAQLVSPLSMRRRFAVAETGRAARHIIFCVG